MSRKSNNKSILNLFLNRQRRLTSSVILKVFGFARIISDIHTIFQSISNVDIDNELQLEIVGFFDRKSSQMFPPIANSSSTFHQIWSR